MGLACSSQYHIEDTKEAEKQQRVRLLFILVAFNSLF